MSTKLSHISKESGHDHERPWHIGDPFESYERSFCGIPTETLRDSAPSREAPYCVVCLEMCHDLGGEPSPDHPFAHPPSD